MTEKTIIKISVAALAIMAGAWAMSNVHAANAAAAPQPAIVSVTLSPADLNALIGALSKLPYDQAMPFIQFLTIKEEDAQRAHAPPTKP